ncbi:OLC1v1029405C1 [Oldenlandia corymbosa var. corymbosa]|uniref:OLC1v1029405C1 n=1 Tax=Oldenlandia corymbosa var. corymbosa TaxID=529605 RepID=A0AAV1CGS3_OLDCO|nr:OLC1v1029405C1 [Oldenlandia corymbosa var. corymbosa]
MVNLIKVRNFISAIESNIVLNDLSPIVGFFRYCHFEAHSDFNSNISSLPSLPTKKVSKTVGIFWDLDNKPPKSFPPYDAAVRLKNAVAEFGFVRYMIAYANRHAFSYVPPEVMAQRKERKELNRLERKGIVKPSVPYKCRVCGRKFHTNERLINHFKQIHESEQRKRLNRIESARGKKRLNLVAQYSMKMEKYRNAARDVLTPKIGYGLAGELKRAGYWVRTVSDKPQAADVALRNHMVDLMDKKLVDCIVLVSDDSDFIEVLKEAKLRCLKTVVVGDINDGALKRTADASFSWQEIMKGKAKAEAGSVVERWKDKDILKRLEWTYDPATEKELCYSDFESEDSDLEEFFSGDEDSSVQQENPNPWWKLQPATRGVNSFSQSER